ncbi:hypothetical protein P43SY_006178 [Pythium insidiosum]|uniref:Apple domain-containing protein n=1 Tax=Pythium insidiosum TaxID=114742 RepID=A0AAD5M8I2_PYTIN|nr:hypothetical protein P43SY_006178 [Pythium insidiosum]
MKTATTVLVIATAAALQTTALACDKVWNDVCFTYAANDDVYWGTNCDFAARDITSMRGGADKCGGFCKSTPSCERWSWNDYQGGTCWLKAKAPFDLIQKQGVNCGFRKFPRS